MKNIVIEIRNGALVDVLAEKKMRVIVHDYDTENFDEKDYREFILKTTKVPSIIFEKIKGEHGDTNG